VRLHDYEHGVVFLSVPSSVPADAGYL
jgi:hypothetical protein